MVTLIDGKSISSKILERAQKKISSLRKKGIKPKLAVILVGNNRASIVYVEKKEKAAKSIGLNFVLHKLPETSTTREIITLLKTIQCDSELTGLIVQLPLPPHIDQNEVINSIRPEVDVDCLTNENIGKLVMNTGGVMPPTAGAIMAVLKEIKAKLPGANITVVGMGALVGKPVSIMLYNEHASVTTCDYSTKDLKDKCSDADIVISGVGKKDLICGEMIKKGAIVIDAGNSYENHKAYGDVDFDEVSKKASFLTPTPGGIGPITVAMLIKNTVACAEKKFKIM